MTDSMDIKKLTEYRCHINNTVVESMKESVAKLNEAMAMIADLQSINDTLVLELAEAEKDNQSQAKDLDILKQKIESRKEFVECAEKKERQYSSMDLSVTEIAALLASLKEKERKLEKEKESFELEKDSIISAKLEAEEKAKRYLKDKNDAINSRDTAITERDKAISDLKIIKEAKKKAEKESIEARDDMKWYKNYASAIDRKIVAFFRNNNEDLDRHYYTFLNNPDKLDEIRIHFPDYNIEDDKTKSENEEPIEGSEKGGGPNTVTNKNDTYSY